MLHEALLCHSREGVNRRHTVSGSVAEQNAIFNMDRGDPAGFQNPQELRYEEIHLPEKSVIILVMTEIVIRWRILIMIAEWD